MYLDGESSKSVAKRFGVSDVTILNHLKKNDVPRRTNRRGVQVMERKTFIDEYQEGSTIRDIARKHRTSQDVVRRVLDEGGVPRRGQPRGAKHWGFKNGRATNSGGYVIVLVDETDQFSSMRTSNGYVLEHRLVMARHLGRSLFANETVHHINGNRSDNKISNLELRVGAHGQGVKIACSDCGSTRISYVPIGDPDA